LSRGLPVEKLALYPLLHKIMLKVFYYAFINIKQILSLLSDPLSLKGSLIIFDAKLIIIDDILFFINACPLPELS
jgi:hypothetical protein